MAKLAWSAKTNVNPLLTTRIIAAIPCHNTQRSISKVIAAAKQYVDEVIVINDGSTDLTAEAARAENAIVIEHNENKGYGEAIKSCFKAARSLGTDILIIIDGDGQHSASDIPSLLKPIIHGGADVVIGSRFINEVKGVPRYRVFGIKVINSLWNAGSKLKLTDTQSGFRAYKKNIIQGMEFTEKGMGISVEILEKARRKGARFEEVPISCSYENNNSSISFQAFRHGLSVVLTVIKIRMNNRFIFFSHIPQTRDENK
jgi:glycosyltransferase involved in cell wall biosynthesis